jgi:dipeptidyl-peptidase 4
LLAQLWQRASFGLKPAPVRQRFHFFYSAKATAMSFTLMTTLLFSTLPPQFLTDVAATKNFTLGRPVGARLLPDGKTVLFLRSEARQTKQLLYSFSVATGETTLLLSPETLLNGASEVLSVEEKARRERMRVSASGFSFFKLSKDGARVLVSVSGQLYVYSLTDKKVLKLNTGAGSCLDAQFSPDGLQVAYVRDYDVRRVVLKENVEQQVTFGGTAVKPNGLAEFVAQEEMGRFSGFWFSPSSDAIVFQKSDHTGVEQLSVPDPMHPERQADRFYYPRPGMKNVVTSLAVVNFQEKKVKPIEWNKDAFPYLTTVKWVDAAPLTVVVQNRAQSIEQVLKVDAKTGATSLLLEEKHEQWLNIDQTFPLWKPDGSGFFWMSEKSGTRDISLVSADGKAQTPWAQNVETAAHYAAPSDTLFVTGGPNPTELYIYAIKAGGAPTRLLSDASKRAETATSFSLTGEVALVHSTRLEADGRIDIVTTNGQVLGTLPSVAQKAPVAANAEILQLPNDGLWAMILKPSGMKRGVKYPVVLSVYGGPHHLEVTRDQDRLWLSRWLADQGFVVVKFDGRGTPRRGAKWERAISGDFATPIVEDQLAGLRQLAALVPEMDLGRVGVYGWSFGGYLSALLTMSQPQHIKAGVAGAPVVDWHDYDTHYTERYLGVPPAAEAAYQKSSLLSYVDKAQRPLLLIHGTADDNVYFMHSLKLSNALFRAGKPHALLPLPNFTHMVPEAIVTQRLWERIATHFKENL